MRGEVDRPVNAIVIDFSFLLCANPSTEQKLIHDLNMAHADQTSSWPRVLTLACAGGGASNNPPAGGSQRPAGSARPAEARRGRGRAGVNGGVAGASPAGVRRVAGGGAGVAGLSGSAWPGRPLARRAGSVAGTRRVAGTASRTAALPTFTAPVVVLAAEPDLPGDARRFAVHRQRRRDPLHRERDAADHVVDALHRDAGALCRDFAAPRPDLRRRGCRPASRPPGSTSPRSFDLTRGPADCARRRLRPRQAEHDRPAQRRTWRFMTFDRSAGGARCHRAPTLASRAGFHIRGQSSAMYAKPPYRDRAARRQRRTTRTTRSWGCRPSPTGSLNSPYPDKALIRNAFVYSLGRDMGMPAPRFAFAEVYLNCRGSSRLTPPTTSGVVPGGRDDQEPEGPPEPPAAQGRWTSRCRSLSGGYIFKFELIAVGGAAAALHGGEATCWKDLELFDPLPVQPAQQSYITQYIQTFHDNLHGTGFADPTTATRPTSIRRRSSTSSSSTS